MEFHPFSQIFPLLDPESEQFLALCEDIKQRGLNDPILTFEDKILDGRNRFNACHKVGKPARFKKFDGDEVAALAYVWSHNFARRHMTEDQRVACVTKYELVRVEAENKAKQLAGVKANPVANSPQGSGATRKAIAEKAGVSEHKARQSIKLEKENPDLLKDVASGKKSLKQAEKEADAKKPKLSIVPKQSRIEVLPHIEVLTPEKGRGIPDGGITAKYLMQIWEAASDEVRTEFLKYISSYLRERRLLGSLSEAREAAELAADLGLMPKAEPAPNSPVDE